MYVVKSPLSDADLKTVSEALQGALVDDTTAVQTVVDALGAVIGRMRERIAASGEPDPVSQDIFIQITADLEKQHWMFQAENG